MFDVKSCSCTTCISRDQDVILKKQKTKKLARCQETRDIELSVPPQISGLKPRRVNVVQQVADVFFPLGAVVQLRQHRVFGSRGRHCSAPVGREDDESLIVNRGSIVARPRQRMEGLLWTVPLVG